MRWVLLYLSMVGVPLLALLAILRVGERIVPPVALGGEWQVEFERVPSGAECAAFEFAGTTVLRIAQSGTYLTLRFGEPRRTTLKGRLAGRALEGWARIRSETPCGDTLRVQATAGPGDLPTELSGRFEVTACDACPRLPFRATR